METLQITQEYDFVVDEIIWESENEYIKGLRVRDPQENTHYLPLRGHEAINIKEGSNIRLKVKDYNENFDKYFFDIVYDIQNSGMELGEVYNFTIRKLIKNEYTNELEAVVVVDSIKNTHYLPLPDSYTKDYQIGDSIELRLRDFNKYSNKFFFEIPYDLRKYTVGGKYTFNVIKTIETAQGYHVFLIEDPLTSVRTTVRAFEEQLHPNQTPTQLICEVKDIESSKLILFQDSLPLDDKLEGIYDIFKDGVNYDFSYIEKNDAENKILARGIDGKVHSLNTPFNLTKTSYKEGDIISYVYNSSSPMRFIYFITFDDCMSSN